MSRLSAVAARLLRRAAFTARHVWARRRLVRRDEVEMLGLRLVVEPGVFHPALFPSSALLAGHLSSLDLTGRNVLDMGTGSGIAGLAAARAGARVVAVDVEAAATGCARQNAERNGLAARVEVAESDLFAALDGRGPFDLIAWNPPFYPRAPRDGPDRAWAAGEGYRVIATFARQATPFLAPGGAVLLVLSSDVDVAGIARLFADAGLRCERLREQRLGLERLYLYRFARPA